MKWSTLTPYSASTSHLQVRSITLPKYLSAGSACFLCFISGREVHILSRWQHPAGYKNAGRPSGRLLCNCMQST